MLGALALRCTGAALTLFSDSMGIPAEVSAKPNSATPSTFRRGLFMSGDFRPIAEPPIIVEDYSEKSGP
jgi:hypothetical protein